MGLIPKEVAMNSIQVAGHKFSRGGEKTSKSKRESLHVALNKGRFSCFVEEVCMLRVDAGFIFSDANSIVRFIRGKA